VTTWYTVADFLSALFWLLKTFCFKPLHPLFQLIFGGGNSFIIAQVWAAGVVHFEQTALVFNAHPILNPESLIILNIL